MQPLTEQAANEIWDLLVEMGGASRHPDSRRDFVYLQTTEVISEYRFQGLFGFGGKFWRNNGRWYVNHYPEDDSPSRNRTRDQINGQLEELYRKHMGEEPEQW